MSRCSICRDVRAAKINADIRAGFDIATLMARWFPNGEVSRATMNRHARKCVGLYRYNSTHSSSTAPAATTRPASAASTISENKAIALRAKAMMSRKGCLASMAQSISRLEHHAHHIAAAGNNLGAANVEKMAGQLKAQMLTTVFGDEQTYADLPELAGLPPTQQLELLVANTLRGNVSVELSNQLGKLISQSAQAIDSAALQSWLRSVRAGQHPLEAALTITGYDPRLVAAARRQGIVVDGEVIKARESLAGANPSPEQAAPAADLSEDVDLAGLVNALGIEL